MRIENNLNNVRQRLLKGEKVLLSVDGIWSLTTCANANNPIEELLQIPCTKENCCIEMLVSDIKMLKAYLIHLHPRIETLLYYHERPLKIKFSNLKNLPAVLLDESPVFFRLAKDPFIASLIITLEQPLLACSFMDDSNKMALPVEKIDMKGLPAPDYIFESFSNESLSEKQPVLSASFDDEGMLSILD